MMHFKVKKKKKKINVLLTVLHQAWPLGLPLLTLPPQAPAPLGVMWFHVHMPLPGCACSFCLVTVPITIPRVR